MHLVKYTLVLFVEDVLYFLANNVLFGHAPQFGTGFRYFAHQTGMASCRQMTQSRRHVASSLNALSCAFSEV